MCMLKFLTSVLETQHLRLKVIAENPVFQNAHNRDRSIPSKRK